MFEKLRLPSLLAKKIFVNNMNEDFFPKIFFFVNLTNQNWEYCFFNYFDFSHLNVCFQNKIILLFLFRVSVYKFLHSFLSSFKLYMIYFLSFF